MATKDKLFRLIRSMSRNEKGYFKKFVNLSSGKKNKQYIKLFDAINKQKEYDEAKILALFKKDQIDHHLPETKHYLFNLILKCLQIYTKEKSFTIGLRSLINNIEILMQRGMHEDCLPLIAKAKKMAIDAGKIPIFFDLAEIEAVIFYDNTPKSLLDGALDLWHKQIEEQIDELTLLFSFYGSALNITANVFLKDHKRENNIWNKQLLQEKIKQFDVWEHKVKSDETKRKILSLKGFLAHSNRDFPSAVSHFSKVVEIIEQNALLKKTTPHKYVVAKANLGKAIENSGNVDLAKKVYQETFSFLVQNRSGLEQREYLIAFLHLFTHLIGLLINCMEYEEVERLIDENKADISSIKERNIFVRWYYALIYMIAAYYFFAGNISKALSTASEIIENPSENNQSFYLSARMLDLLCHYELENKEYFPYAARSLYYFLRTKTPEYQFERLLIQFLSKINNEIDEEQIIEAFSLFREQLNGIKSDPKEASVFKIFPYIPWLTSKVENRPFSEVLKEDLTDRGYFKK